MSRKNRVVVSDGLYHVTARVANKAHLLKDEALKEKIVDWMYGIADFCGVDVFSWAVLDNHLHIMVHVPPVPEKYRIDAAVEPPTYAFSMRPPECRPPRWDPRVDPEPAESPLVWNGDSPLVGNGDRPLIGNGDRPFGMVGVRPAVGFMLSDAEMLERLMALYGDRKRIETLRKCWADWRALGHGFLVDEAKTRYCRRMYNISQFMKTLSERIASYVNRTTGHEGRFWSQRFYSGLVQPETPVIAVVSAYIAYNPVKSGQSPTAEAARWTSYGRACGNGKYGERCRAAYERCFGKSWAEVRRMFEGIFADRLPDNVDIHDEKALDRAKLRASQIIHMPLRCFSRGVFIGRDNDFVLESVRSLARGFYSGTARLARWCLKLDWRLPVAA